jgi:hypothetical protein
MKWMPRTTTLAYLSMHHWGEKTTIDNIERKDDSVECFLTEQLLEIRRRLQPKFAGCDIYKPKKPKGKGYSLALAY